MAASSVEFVERSEGSQNGARDTEHIHINGTNDMICAPCCRYGQENGAAGICKVCKFYLCSDCVTQHRKSEDTKDHRVAFFYCARKFAVNKLVRANSFCLDCGHYLCEKCKLDHGGFRMYRNHTFIGGRSVPDQVFGHEDAGDRGILRSRSTSRPTASRVSRRTRSDDGRKSPYLSNQATIERKSRKAEMKVEEPINLSRTLIHTSTGRSPTRSSELMKNSLSRHGERNDRDDTDIVTDEAELIGEYSAKAPSDRKPCEIIMSIVLGNNKLVVADRANKSIKAFDPMFKFIGQIAVDTFPVSLCESRQNETDLFASSGKIIYIFSAAKGFKVAKTIETDVRRVEGLTSWQSGVVIVFKAIKSRNDRRGHIEVHLLNFDGEVQYQLTVSSQYLVKLVTPIWYVATSNDDRELLLSDTHNNRIISVDLVHWHLNYVIKGKTANGKPSSLVVDPEDNLLVAWYNEVRKVSPCGRDLGTIVRKIDRKAVISYNRRSDCLVVHSGSKLEADKIRVYQM